VIMKILFYLLFIFSLLPAQAHARENLIGSITEGLVCHQSVDPEWEFVGMTPYGTIYIDPTKRKLKGKIDKTLLLVRNDRLVEVAFAVDTNDTKKERYRHIGRIYKQLVREYEEPVDGVDGWMWMLDFGLLLYIESYGPGSVLGVACPPMDG